MSAIFRARALPRRSREDDDARVFFSTRSVFRHALITSTVSIRWPRPRPSSQWGDRRFLGAMIRVAHVHAGGAHRQARRRGCAHPPYRLMRPNGFLVHRRHAHKDHVRDVRPRRMTPHSNPSTLTASQPGSSLLSSNAAPEVHLCINLACRLPSSAGIIVRGLRPAVSTALDANLLDSGDDSGIGRRGEVRQEGQVPPNGLR